jgi:hypothetical protein
MAEERRIKCYGFNGTLEFIEKNYDEAARKRIIGSLSPAARDFIGTSKKAQWASPLYSSELWAGIAKEHPDQEEARKQLVKAGRHFGAYATNTYLKLLMKMLTVKMFAKKIPDLWGRDTNFGKITLGDIDEISQGKLTINYTELGDYPYFGPTTEGWFAFGLETMGLKELTVTAADWSMKNPNVDQLTYRITWKA